MTNRIRLSLLAAAATLLPGSALADTAHPIEVPQHSAETTDAGATGPALWQVADEDTTIYLFGTVHALRPGLAWLTDDVSAALAASDEVVTEVDMSAMEAEMVKQMPKAMLADGGNLRELMTDDNRTQYEAAMTKLGLPVEAFDPFEPWFAAMTLQMLPLMQQGYDPAEGVEMILLGKASPEATRGALETMDYQIDVFDGLPMETQLAYLDQSVEQSDELVPMLDEMVASWMSGDADALGSMMAESLPDRTLYDRLLTTRNENWAAWIEDRMEQPGTVFIAVGAGHLGGADSVQVKLAERGIATTLVD